MIVDTIKKAIKDAVSALSLETGEIHLEHPVDLMRGDYSTNIAMMLAEKSWQKPKRISAGDCR